MMAARVSLLDKLALHAPHLSSKRTIPVFVYGTAWKKEATTDLVFQALSNGFTAIDTACQPKHYREDLVGEGVRRAIAETSLKRADIFIQTKYTSIGGQDPNDIPYDPNMPIIEQVKQSVAVSLGHFDTTHQDGSNSGAYLDSVVLHSPMRNIEETMEVWHTLEKYVPQQIHNIGISNCDLFTLMNVYERANIKPAVVQNRFYPQTKFDIGIRKFCRDKGILYQTFWTLSANPHLLRSKPVQALASHAGIGRESALYCLVLSLENTVVLNGTTKVKHMQEDWSALKAVQEWSASNSAIWQATMEEFMVTIGESSPSR